MTKFIHDKDIQQSEISIQNIRNRLKQQLQQLSTLQEDSNNNTQFIGDITTDQILNDNDIYDIHITNDKQQQELKDGDDDDDSNKENIEKNKYWNDIRQRYTQYKSHHPPPTTTTADNNGVQVITQNINRQDIGSSNGIESNGTRINNDHDDVLSRSFFAEELPPHLADNLLDQITSLQRQLDQRDMEIRAKDHELIQKDQQLESMLARLNQIEIENQDLIDEFRNKQIQTIKDHHGKIEKVRKEYEDEIKRLQRQVHHEKQRNDELINDKIIELQTQVEKSDKIQMKMKSTIKGLLQKVVMIRTDYEFLEQKYHGLVDAYNFAISKERMTMNNAFETNFQNDVIESVPDKIVEEGVDEKIADEERYEYDDDDETDTDTDFLLNGSLLPRITQSNNQPPQQFQLDPTEQLLRGDLILDENEGENVVIDKEGMITIEQQPPPQQEQQPGDIVQHDLMRPGEIKISGCKSLASYIRMVIFIIRVQKLAEVKLRKQRAVDKFIYGDNGDNNANNNKQLQDYFKSLESGV